MNQADVSKLVSRLRVKVNPTHRRLKNPRGPEGRLDKLRQTVTGLIKHERIELKYTTADEVRPYVERLISEAIRHGDGDARTMEMADYWLVEKQLVHKLFKVLVPRYSNYTQSYTRMFKLSRVYPDKTNPFSLLELKGNPYPPLVEDLSSNRNLLHNVLLDAARRDYRMNQYKQAAEAIPTSAAENVAASSAESVATASAESVAAASAESVAAASAESVAAASTESVAKTSTAGNTADPFNSKTPTSPHKP